MKFGWQQFCSNQWKSWYTARIIFSIKVPKEIVQADKLALLATILLFADVSPTYSSGLPQGSVF